jgi:hypothetical protein
MIKKVIFLLLLIVLSSCESETERKAREDKAEKQRIDLEARMQQEAEELAFQKEHRPFGYLYATIARYPQCSNMFTR